MSEDMDVSALDFPAHGEVIPYKDESEIPEIMAAANKAIQEKQAKKEKEDKIISFLPDNLSVDPLEYVDLVLKQILGYDKSGALRSGADLKMFLYQCKKTGLDPLAKQIHAVYRSTYVSPGVYEDKMSIQTGIDGFRAIAERTGIYGGSDDAVFEEKEDLDHPIRATVTVYKINRTTGDRMPVTASARWSEYAQKKTDRKTGVITLMGKWSDMPYLMLAKCAESLALRKAFPNDLSGIYTNEEMSQASNAVPMIAKTPAAKELADKLLQK